MTADLKNIQKADWDTLIVGTGLGGATLGHALAREGEKVLFIEKGADYLNNPDALRGNFLESLVPNPEDRTPLTWRNGGRSDAKLWDVRKNRWVKPIMGSGTGGSSALYGMVMERFWPQDFEPRQYHPQSPDSVLPNRWPFGFKDLEPYYEAAEKLYGVTCTSVDPFRPDQTFFYRPGPCPDPKGARLSRFLRSRGVHPYGMPLALDWKEGCQFCQSFLCDKDCKNDSAKVCLRPALRDFGAVLVPNAEVLTLEADDRRVTGVQALIGNERFHFRAKRVVLAAGALWTPLLLLRSCSDRWPNGLANRSGLVGRNLTRHYIDLLAILSRSTFPKHYTLKELLINDFYSCAEGKFGAVGAFGHMPPSFMITEDIENDLAVSGKAWAQRLFRFGRPLVRKVLSRLFQQAGYLALILEDLPFRDNRVYWREDAGGTHPALDYLIRPSEWDRIRKFRRMVRGVLFPNPTLLFAQADNLKFLAHISGTCCAGEDPRASVVDRWGRAHDLENLYLADASVFPSAGGTNPGLTVAANALRVAAHLCGKTN